MARMYSFDRVSRGNEALQLIKYDEIKMHCTHKCASTRLAWCDVYLSSPFCSLSRIGILMTCFNRMCMHVYLKPKTLLYRWSNILVNTYVSRRRSATKWNKEKEGICVSLVIGSKRRMSANKECLQAKKQPLENTESFFGSTSFISSDSFLAFAKIRCLRNAIVSCVDSANGPFSSVSIRLRLCLFWSRVFGVFARSFDSLRLRASIIRLLFSFWHPHKHRHTYSFSSLTVLPSFSVERRNYQPSRAR